MKSFWFFNIINELDDRAVLMWLRRHPLIIEDDLGITASAQATYNGRVNLVKMILREGLSPPRSLGSSVLGGAFQCKDTASGCEILEFALDRFGYPHHLENISIANYLPELNEPLVHGAIRRRRYDFLNILVLAGADLDAIDSDGVSGIDLLNQISKMK